MALTLYSILVLIETQRKITLATWAWLIIGSNGHFLLWFYCCSGFYPSQNTQYSNNIAITLTWLIHSLSLSLSLHKANLFRKLICCANKINQAAISRSPSQNLYKSTAFKFIAHIFRDIRFGTCKPLTIKFSIATEIHYLNLHGKLVFIDVTTLSFHETKARIVTVSSLSLYEELLNSSLDGNLWKGLWFVPLSAGINISKPP